MALDAHSSILIESYSMKESERRTYIGKCVDDIKKVGTSSPEKDEGFSEPVFYILSQGVWVVPGFRQLHRFAKGFYKTNYGQKDQVGVLPLRLAQSGTQSSPTPSP